MASEAVKVIVRCRPLNQREKDLNSKVILNMDQSCGQCSITNPSDAAAPAKTFSYDGAYFIDSTTEQIYNEIVFPLVESVTEGYNGTVFAYGQTGCGKSFTMQGIASPASQRGIIPRAFEHIFEAIATAENTKFLVHASYLEIYNEEIRDLLGKDCKKKLELKEHNDSGVYVTGLSMHPVHNVKNCEQIMEQGWKNRSVGATLMNADSSRSHSIFTIYLERMETQTCDENNIRKGKLNLVDLAGSERQAKTGATGDRLKEATKINLSLSALGNVISALVDGKSKHIPYRDSKLTRLLQDSLGGNTKTLMVACLSPADNNYDETLSTLRYANRAKNIQNKPKINEDPKEALLREYQEEIMRLKSLISGQVLDKNEKPINDESVIEKIKQEYDQQMQDLAAKFKEEQESNAKLKDDMSRLKSEYELKLNNITTDPITTNSSITNENKDKDITQAEALERLQMLQGQMVGGEKANDAELKEKRAKRKKIAEKKINAISEALLKLDDDDRLLLKAYDDITEELRARTLLLKRAKKKIQALEQEINDIQSEFESDRTDYLETIRKQDGQIKLISQILEKIQPCLRRDCNYANIDRIKSESVWDEDLQKWRLPNLIVTRTKLPPPPGGMHTGGREQFAPSSLYRPSSSNGYTPTHQDDDSTSPTLSSSPSEDRLFQRLEKGEKEDIASSYFKPKRREQLLTNANKVKLINESLHHFEDVHQTKNKDNNQLSNGTNNVSNHLQSLNGVHSSTNTIMNTTNTHNNSNRQFNSKSVPSKGYNKTNASIHGSTNTVNTNVGGSLSAGEAPRKLSPIRLETLQSASNLNLSIGSKESSSILSRNNIFDFMNR